MGLSTPPAYKQKKIPLDDLEKALGSRIIGSVR